MLTKEKIEIYRRSMLARGWIHANELCDFALSALVPAASAGVYPGTICAGMAALAIPGPAVAIASTEEDAPVGLPAGATKHDWPEDWPHENGLYYCRCHQCDNTFFGYKRRRICKACAPSIPPVSEGDGK
jgi:hypothetical protein